MTELNAFLNPKNLAVVVIDVQNDYCHTDGAVARLGMPVESIQQSVPVLEQFLEEVRSRGIKVLFVRTAQNESTLSQVWKKRGVYRPENVIAREDSWGAEFYRIQPRSGEPIITKHRYSAFINTNLDLILRSENIQRIIFTGYTTNVCVESTARHAAMNDYFITVASDCTAATSVAEHEASLHNIKSYFGKVLSSTEILNYWGSLNERIASSG